MSNDNNKYPNLAVDVNFTVDSIWVELANGHFVRAPLDQFPRLLAASEAQRRNWRFTGGGLGVHWPDLNEDISVPELLALFD